LRLTLTCKWGSVTPFLDVSGGPKGPHYFFSFFVSATLVLSVPLDAHNGPPFPVITDRPVGNYIVSLWADPDASDEGDADGRFWVVLSPVAKGTALPADTVVQISIWPVERPDSIRTETAAPDGQEISRRTAAFVINHEGKYAVKATIAGPLGPAEVNAVVDAQYDARPRPALIAIFALPFVLMGFVWVKLLMRRRANNVGTA
jgi:hypothetical protein